MASIDEYRKFAASAPEAEREFRTIELYHSDFSETLRFVQDFIPTDLVLEAEAPRDGGLSVTFLPISMNIEEPSESGEVEQMITVSLGAVGGEVNDQINQITDTLEPVQFIYRKYYSGDLSEPVLILSLTVSNVNFKDYNSVGFTAEDTDFAVKRAGELYLIERFKGLRLL